MTSLSPSLTDELTSIAHLLHLTYHRNKNQHRLAKWWKALSQLKRQTQKLIPEFSALDTAVKFSSSSSKSAKIGKGEKAESKYVLAARDKVEARVVFLEKWVVPKCYSAFSNVVADNQYATLGLMLMGILASFRSVIRPFGKGEEEDGNVGPGIGEVVSDGHVRVAPEDDFGEVVRREEVEIAAPVEEDVEEAEAVVAKKLKKSKWREVVAQDQMEEVEAESTPAKRPKKKRKNGDAFDDLFAGLI